MLFVSVGACSTDSSKLQDSRFWGQDSKTNTQISKQSESAEVTETALFFLYMIEMGTRSYNPWKKQLKIVEEKTTFGAPGLISGKTPSRSQRKWLNTNLDWHALGAGWQKRNKNTKKSTSGRFLEIIALSKHSLAIWCSMCCWLDRATHNSHR